jgi:Ni/Co efflux regulator RcnB
MKRILLAATTVGVLAAGAAIAPTQAAPPLGQVQMSTPESQAEQVRDRRGHRGHRHWRHRHHHHGHWRHRHHRHHGHHWRRHYRFGLNEWRYWHPPSYYRHYYY